MTQCRLGRSLPVTILFLFAVALVAPLAADPAAANDEVTVVAVGLANPRGLGIGDKGSVYVAESGRGGDGPCIPGPEGEDVCYGESGAVTLIDETGQRRVVEDLPSLAPVGGVGAVGPTDVVTDGKKKVWVIVGLGGNPALRADLPPGAQDLGRMLRIDSRRGTLKPFSDIAAFEALVDPDADMGGDVDSNPVAVIRRGSHFVVVDAGGNSLLRVDGKGRISLLAVFDVRLVPAPPFIPVPMIPMQSVPTSVTSTKGKELLVGELTGFPFPEGLARIFRLDDRKKRQDPEVFLEGFTHILDVAFFKGDLYVLQISKRSLLLPDLPVGALIRVARDGTREELIPGRLIAPTGLAIDEKERALYVSNGGIFPGGGEVLRIDLRRH